MRYPAAVLIPTDKEIVRITFYPSRKDRIALGPRGGYAGSGVGVYKTAFDRLSAVVFACQRDHIPEFINGGDRDIKNVVYPINQTPKILFHPVFERGAF